MPSGQLIDMKPLQPIVLVLLSLSFVCFASAQFIVHSKVKDTTVDEVLRNGAEDQSVQLLGNLSRKLGRERYEFSDGTGSIHVEIDDEIFPAEPISERTRVQIRGEVEKEALTSVVEIDVKTVQRVD